MGYVLSILRNLSDELALLSDDGGDGFLYGHGEKTWRRTVGQLFYKTF